MDLTKVANVLDAMADYIDANEYEKSAEIRAAKEERIVTISEKYASATGETVSDELLQKMATADLPLLDAMEKVADAKREDPLHMGDPSDRRDFSVEPENRKEAAEMADERFKNWILE